MSVSTLFCTRPSNTVLPSATTVSGLEKSKASGERSSVNAATPRVSARTMLPSRATSTRPVGRSVEKSGDTRFIIVGR